MSENKLYVGNLPTQASKEEVQEAFAQFGQVSELKIIFDHYTNESRGFAFVTFSNAHDAKEALNMNGSDFQGKRLKVSVARESNWKSR